MRVEPVTVLAGKPQDVLIDTRNVNRNRMIMGPRREERGHERKVIVLPLKCELLAPFRPAFEDRLQREDIFAQLRHRCFPFYPIAPLDMAFDLCPKPQNETSLRQGGQVPRRVRHRHWTPWKRDRDRGPKLDSPRMLCG